MTLLNLVASVSKSKAILASFAVSSSATVVLYSALQSTGDCKVVVVFFCARLRLIVLPKWHPSYRVDTTQLASHRPPARWPDGRVASADHACVLVNKPVSNTLQLFWSTAADGGRPSMVHVIMEGAQLWSCADSFSSHIAIHNRVRQTARTIFFALHQSLLCSMPCLSVYLPLGSNGFPHFFACVSTHVIIPFLRPDVPKREPRILFPSLILLQNERMRDTVAFSFTTSDTGLLLPDKQQRRLLISN